MQESTTTPILHPILVGAQRLGIGKSKLWQEVAAGRIKVVKIGRRTLVPESELQRYADELLKQAEQ